MTRGRFAMKLIAGMTASVVAAGEAAGQIRLGSTPPPASAPPAPGRAAPAAPAATRQGGAKTPGIKWVAAAPGTSGRRPYDQRTALPFGYALAPFWAYDPYGAAWSGGGMWTPAGAEPPVPAAPTVSPIVLSGVGAPVVSTVERRVGRTKVIESGFAASAAAAGLLVASVGDSLLRLTWLVDDRPVRGVSLFTADTSRRTIALQTVRVEPFTALLYAVPAIAYIGVTVAFHDGSVTTSLVPHRPAGH